MLHKVRVVNITKASWQHCHLINSIVYNHTNNHSMHTAFGIFKRCGWTSSSVFLLCHLQDKGIKSAHKKHHTETEHTHSDSFKGKIKCSILEEKISCSACSLSENVNMLSLVTFVQICNFCLLFSRFKEHEVFFLPTPGIFFIHTPTGL